MPPPPVVTAPPTSVECAATPADRASSRPQLDEQVRTLLVRSGDLMQRQRAERREFDGRLIKVLQLLTELDDDRRFLTERVSILEERLAVIEQTSVAPGDLALARH